MSSDIVIIIIVVIVSIVGEELRNRRFHCSFGSHKDRPYMGQRTCPVSGTRLGLTGQPIAIDTRVGARQPSFFGKLFGRKATAGVVIYVCCPQCAAKVKNNPSTYVGKVLAEVNGWSAEIAENDVGSPPRSR